jgi:hypothetical protein
MQIFNVCSVAIVIGLFVNYLFNISTLFTGSSSIAIEANIFMLTDIIYIILFFVIIKKYLLFAYSWIRMQNNLFKNNEKNIIQMLNNAELLITNHCKDYIRYILLCFFILIMINRKISIMSIGHSVNVEPRLLALGIILYLSIIAIIEWPSLSFWNLYRKTIKNKVTPSEGMSFG